MKSMQQQYQKLVTEKTQFKAYYESEIQHLKNEKKIRQENQKNMKEIRSGQKSF